MWAQSAIEMGRIVTAGRRQRGWTQAQLAKAAGVTQNWLSQIEQGKDTAQVGKVLQILSFLGIRLRVGEAPWLPAHARKPVKSKRPGLKNVSLADIIAAHSDIGAPHRKAKR